MPATWTLALRARRALRAEKGRPQWKKNPRGSSLRASAQQPQGLCTAASGPLHLQFPPSGGFFPKHTHTAPPFLKKSLCSSHFLREALLVHPYLTLFCFITLTSWDTELLGWTKSLFWFFHNILNFFANPILPSLLTYSFPSSPTIL